MIIKKIGTGKLGADKVVKREDETAALDNLRQSLGANNTMSRGTVLQGRYEIEHVIGYGGMSTVYRARDMRFSDIVRTVAIKEMFDASSDPTARKDKISRFKSEANLLASLNHQSIPKIFDFFEDQDRSYLIMELIEGKNLETILEDTNAAIDERTVIEWGIEICDVLSYLHNRKPSPLIFRDMKPSNVMLNQEGRLILIDFGIVKVFQDEKKGTMIGTEGYSPPEQYRGQALPQGDIYALGATLHQLLTNSDPRMEVPFTFHERMPTAINNSLSKDTELVVMKALEFEKDKRWQSVDIMKTELIKVLNRLSGGASPTKGAAVDATRNLKIDPTMPPATPSSRAAGTNPTMRNEVPATSSMQRKTGAGGIGVEIIHSVSDNLPTLDLVWRFACEEEVRSTPTLYKTTLFVGSYDTNLYALDSKTGEFLWKAATEDGICTTPVILENPNQTLILVGSEDRRMYAYDVVKGNEVWQFPTSGKIRSSARIYQNFVFFGSDDRQLYALEAKSGKQAWKYRAFGEIRSTPVVHGGFVYFGSDDGHLYSLDISSGSLRWRYRAFESIVSTPIVEDNRIYFGSRDGYLYCVDITNGHRTWSFKAQKMINSSPALGNGKVYFGSVDGFLYCIDSKKGTLKWKFDTGSQITSSPKIYNGVVYFGCVDSNVYALDAEKGHAVAYFPTDAPIPGSPIVADNMVYIGSTDFNVYALSAL
jgi:eukaryotic-like serine/threonine-protein kinase